MQRSCKWKRWSHQKGRPPHTRTTDRFGAANPGMNPHEPIPKTGNPKRAKNQPTPGPPLGWVKRGSAFRQSCATTFFTVDRRSTRSWKMVRPDLGSGQTKSCHPSDNDPPRAGSSALGLLGASRRSERLWWTSRCWSTLSCIRWSLNRDIDGSTCRRREVWLRLRLSFFVRDLFNPSRRLIEPPPAELVSEHCRRDVGRRSRVAAILPIASSRPWSTTCPRTPSWAFAILTLFRALVSSSRPALFWILVSSSPAWSRSPRRSWDAWSQAWEVRAGGPWGAVMATDRSWCIVAQDSVGTISAIWG